MGGRAGVLLLVILATLLTQSAHGFSEREMGEEANAHVQELGQVTDFPGQLTRTFFSPAHLRAGDIIMKWMNEAGLQTWKDALGNVRGRTRNHEDGPTLIIGSHYDTIIDGGKFDGALGVVLGVSAVKALISGGARLPFPVEVIGFSDEEGVRFHTTFIGSKAVTGKFGKDLLTDAVDKQGVPLGVVLGVAISGSGHIATDDAIAAAAFPPGGIRAYVEVHIEQGPVLERLNQPLGVVTGIAGQTRMLVTVFGTQGHAGTVPMSIRSDPTPAAAEAIVAVEKRCSVPDVVVCTVGEMRLSPGASNVIARSVEFSLDIRSEDDQTRAVVIADLTKEIEDICHRRKLQCVLQHKHDASARQCSPELVQGLAQAASSVTGTEVGSVPKITSGAGHDALAIADVAPIGMLFVRCKDGLSHTPLEFTSPEDVAASASALLQFLRLYTGVAAKLDTNDEL